MPADLLMLLILLGLVIPSLLYVAGCERLL
jgi:hypothetical protein